MKFWNFYDENKMVVLHNKDLQNDLEDKFSKLILVEGLVTKTYREYWQKYLFLNIFN